MTDEPESTRRPDTAPKPAEKARDDMPAAGPHAAKKLTDKERTPGAGTLPDADGDEVGDGASS